MMEVWQWDSVGCWRAQATRRDMAIGRLFVRENGGWWVENMQGKEIGRGEAGSLDAAKLVSRLVWELSAW